MSIKTLETEMDIECILNDISDLIDESREGKVSIKNIARDLKDVIQPREENEKFDNIN